MNENTNKSINTWTKEHNELCNKHGINGADRYLWAWLLRRGTPGKQTKSDLLEFNAWVEEAGGKPYSLRHLKNCLQKLIDKGLI